MESFARLKLMGMLKLSRSRIRFDVESLLPLIFASTVLDKLKKRVFLALGFKPGSDT